MVREGSERRKAIAFAAVLVVAVSVLVFTASTLNRLDLGNRTVVREVVMRLQGASAVVWYNATETRNVTVFAFLLEASEALDLPVTWFAYGPPLDGVLVTSIGADANGVGNPQRFWQFWVDRAYGTVGADRAVLHDRAFVDWRFVPSQEG